MRHHRYLIAALALGAAAFLVVWLLGLASGARSGSRPSPGPVRIATLQIERLPDASSPRIKLRLEVENYDERGHDIQAWWFLARPGVRQVWNLYAFRSSTQAQALAPGEKTTLGWDEEVAAEPGTYELTAWVHTVEGDVTRHSDSKRLGNPTVRIDSGWSRFARRATPLPGLQVSAVDLPPSALDGGLSVPTELPVTIVVANDTPVETVADVRWFLYRLEPRLPWDAKPAYTSIERVHQVFAPNRQSSVRISERISLWPGEYLLRVVVAGSEGEDEAAGDDLFLSDTVRVLENKDEAGIVRLGPASGPVEVTSLVVDSAAFQQGKGSVKVELRNRSNDKQAVRLWWFLSRPGSLEPWVEFDQQSKVFTADIDPQAQTTLDLSDGSSAPPGTYDISVWVHTLDGQGRQSPSDGAWLSRRLEIE
ncbi:MAG: hypothetical protein Q8P22_07160 [Chloroflexota bacterium]|nr:hypothetical protein [Chloroflexota bacterium]